MIATTTELGRRGSASKPAAPQVRAPLRRVIECLLVLVVVAVVATGTNRRPAPAQSGGAVLGTPERLIPDRLRVATFNMHGGRGSDGRVDLDRVADVLGDIDFVALNEVYGGSGWRSDDQAHQLARRLGLAALFAASERRWWHDYFGNGLLTAAPLRGWHSAPLAGTQGKGYRNMIEAELKCGSRRVHILATHVDRARDRESHLRVVIARFLALPEPAVLMGDLNSTAADPQLAALLARPDVHDAVGPAAPDEERRRIDWILVRGLDVVAAGLRDNGASDHPCLWAEFAVPSETNTTETKHDE